MPSRRPPTQFGDTFLKRAIDVTPDERRRALTPAAALREVVLRGDPGALVRLHDELRGARRFKPPTRDDVTAARRSIEKALRSGELVGLSRLATRAPISLPEFAFPEPPVILEPAPPSEEKPTWFEVNIVDRWGQPLDGLEFDFSSGADRRDLTTNAAGTGRIEGITGSHGSAVIESTSDLRNELRRRAAVATDVAKQNDDDSLFVVGTDDVVAQLEAETPRTIVLAVALARVRLIGMHFDTNKAFLRETAMRGIRKIVAVYEENPSGKLLIVGHTDTTADEQYNLDLSVERAESVKAYLKNDVPAWEAWFDDDKPAKKRWGDAEISHMISALPCEQTVAGFQEFSNDTRGTTLVVDGLAGPRTRRALIEAYMALEGTTLPDGIDAVVHGCGEFFPEDETGDGVEDAENRRVEVFCFHEQIVPPVPGKRAKKGEPEYPQWKNQVTETIDVSAADIVTLFDVVVPLERDLSEAPDLDEELHLVSLDGTIDRIVKHGTPDVTRRGETSLHLFHFRDVPEGTYRVLALSGGVLTQVHPDIELKPGAISTDVENGKALGNPDDRMPDTSPDLETIFEQCWT